MWRDKLKEIIYLLENSEVNEIEVTFWGRKFRVVKNANVVASSGSAQAQQPLASAPAPVVAQATEVSAEVTPQVTPASGTEIKSPMPGTFYKSPSPGADAFVKEGDVVKKGDTLCIIEAMKIMNEIEAEISGVITKILVDDGSPVEYDQPLFEIESRS